MSDLLVSVVERVEAVGDRVAELRALVERMDERLEARLSVCERTDERVASIEKTQAWIRAWAAGAAFVVSGLLGAVAWAISALGDVP